MVPFAVLIVCINYYCQTNPEGHRDRKEILSVYLGGRPDAEYYSTAWTQRARLRKRSPFWGEAICRERFRVHCINSAAKSDRLQLLFLVGNEYH